MNKALKKVIFEYLDTPERDRIPRKQFLKDNHMIRVSLYKGELLYAQEKAEGMKEERLKMLKKREAVDKLGEGLDNASAKESYDSEDFLATRTHKVDKALLTACDRGGAAALKIYYQLTNRLVEKSEQEVKIGLSADEIARRNLEATRQLRESGY